MVATCLLYPRCPCSCHPEVDDECLNPNSCPCDCHGPHANLPPMFVAKAAIRKWVYGHCSQCSNPDSLVVVVVIVARTGEGQAALYCQSCVRAGIVLADNEDEILEDEVED